MRAVLFDVDGVLIHSMFHPDPARCRNWSAHMEMDFGIDRDTFNQFFRKDFGEIVRGRRSIVDALDTFLPTIGVKINTLDFLTYWFENDTPLNLQLLDGIKRLQRTGAAKVYLATNQEHLRAFHLWKELRLNHIFDDMFYAARLGFAKPDAEFFEQVDQAIGPQSQAPLFFDDGQKNVDAANIHGWDGAMFMTEDDFFNHPWIKEQLK
ncbi:HAD-IA family hydrolase [uncultured Maritalea sp.]|uniref:HAD-IA family hydrolase n=1 Tax=uncultured Maritalea sp. TaxID=757249 RepID=UPI00261AEDAE|nr:HAD-IA family hydrolase [uncultured Maritalea sp.]